MYQYNKLYKNKKVLITGHTGFKGTWLTLIMLGFGAKVYGISNNNETLIKKYKINQFKKKLVDINLDIVNQTKLMKVVRKIKPDFIFHLAAQSLVFDSYQNPVITMQTNVFGTQNVLESIRNLEKCSAVFITSDKCYENIETTRGYKESDRLGGKDLYSSSKASAELLIKSYYNSFFKNNKNIRIASARAGNVVGGGDWNKNRLVPDCIKSWSENKTVVLRNPNSTRPWQHVLEPLRGYIDLSRLLHSNSMYSGRSYNFGPRIHKNYTVEELVKGMSAHWKKVKWRRIQKNKSSYFESKLLQLNCNKAKKELNWKPLLGFKDTCFLTIDWYKKYLNNKNKTLSIFKDQIDQYFKLIK
ncbi:CDP-glucose 4,6-dehydratase [Pelagibacteraceae bacterium]|nr:CDP-glucose 4,6-dehydratase [Pelagibacteraceae bacterium]